MSTSTAVQGKSQSPTPPPVIIKVGAPVALHGVTYRQYAALRAEPENDHLRMTYYDGTLEIMSPEYIHERGASRLGKFVFALCSELGIACTSSRSTTFRKAGAGRRRGKGKEPDDSFYIARAEWLTGRDTIDLDAGDPPPDLWIEVDHRGSSKGRLPVYAALGAPEVWRFRTISGRLSFLRLTEGGKYEPIDRSLALPMLTPALVLEALAMGRNLSESHWDQRIRAWVREKFGPRDAGPA